MERLLGYMLMLALTLGGYLVEAAGDPKAADLLKQARLALGGDTQLDRVTALSGTGTISRATGPGARLDGELTLQLALPDRLMRTESLSPDGGITLLTMQGVSGERLLRSARALNTPPGAVIRTPPPPQPGSDAEREALRAGRADLARLVLVLLARDTKAFPLDFAYGGQAESPDGKADVIDVKASDGGTFAAKLFLDQATHRPLMLSWRGVAPRMVLQTRRFEGGQRPPRPEDVIPPREAPEVVDIQMFLDDYRPVSGILLPHHITRAVAGETNEEWTFTSMAVNPTFKADTFEAR